MIKPYERYHWTSLQFNRKIDCLIGIFLFPTVFLTLRGWLPDAHQISSIKGIFPHQTPSLHIFFHFIFPNCELTWCIDVMSDCWPWQCHHNTNFNGSSRLLACLFHICIYAIYNNSSRALTMEFATWWYKFSGFSSQL